MFVKRHKYEQKTVCWLSLIPYMEINFLWQHFLCSWFWNYVIFAETGQTFFEYTIMYCFGLSIDSTWQLCYVSDCLFIQCDIFDPHAVRICYNKECCNPWHILDHHVLLTGKNRAPPITKFITGRVYEFIRQNLTKWTSCFVCMHQHTLS